MTLAAVLMGMTAANAQLIIGGNISFGGDNFNTEDNIRERKTFEDGVLVNQPQTHFNFGFAPKVGYLMMDGKLEIGASLNLQYGLIKDFETYDERPYVMSGNHKKAICTSTNETFSLFVNPYARYYFLQKGCFSLGIQGLISVGGNFFMPIKYTAWKGEKCVLTEWNLATGEKKYEYREAEVKKEDADKWNKIAKENLKEQHKSNFQYGIYVAPVMKFDINEHWYVDVTLDMMGLYLKGDVTTWREKVADDKYTSNKETSFDGGFSALNIGGSYATIGFAYKF